MTVWELVAVVVTVCVIVTMAILLFLLLQLIGVLRDLRSAADRLAEHALPTVDDLRVTLDNADIELERLKGLVRSAEALSRNVQSVSRKALEVGSLPRIKIKAMLAGPVVSVQTTDLQCHQAPAPHIWQAWPVWMVRPAGAGWQSGAGPRVPSISVLIAILSDSFN